MLSRCLCSATFVLLLLCTGACSGPAALPEAPMREAPTVDGTLSEWGGRLTGVDGQAVSMAALPTDSLLYVAVLVRDPALVQAIAQRGLVVWVDPAGGTKRAYGVQYPLGLQRQQAGRTASTTATLDAVTLRELEVVRGDTLRRRIPAQYSSGLRGRAVLDPSSLICELAIPVRPSAEHGLPTALGPTVGLGLHTPEPDDESSPQGQAAPDLSATDPGGRTSPQRRRDARRRQQSAPAPRAQRPTLDLWVTVETARP